MGVVSGTVSINLSLQDFVASGYITPETLSILIATPGIPGAAITYTNGTGSGQVDTLYGKPITLVASTPQTFDLTSLTGLGGEAINFARVRDFFVFNPATTAGQDCKVYQGASNPWAILPASANPGWARYGNGWYWIHDPTSTGSGNGNVVGSTNKTFVLDPGTNGFTVYLVALGGSAA